MKISACIIAKDEEKNISLCLDSLKDQVDEILVVDTGSTDRTAMLAKQAGASVFHYEWENDFSAAKNFALEKATGDWIVFLDADERLTLLASRKVKDFLAEMDVRDEALLIKLINIDVDAEGKVLDYFYTVRIFRNHLNLCYQGKIHEQLGHKNGNALRLYRMNDADMVIYHTGYSTGRIKGKCKRNLKLLLKQLLQGEKTAKLYHHIAQSYVTLEQYKDALPYLRKVHQLPHEATTYQSRYYQMYLVTLEKCELFQSNEYREMLDEALKICSGLPDFHAQKAVLFYHDGKYQQADQEMNLAFHLHAHYSGIEPSFFGEMLEGAKEMQLKIKKRISQINPSSEGNKKAGSTTKENLDYLKMATEASDFLAMHLQIFFFCLLKMDHWDTAKLYAKLLPSKMYPILSRYYGVACLEEIDDALFHALDEYLAKQADHALLVRYRSLIK